MNLEQKKDNMIIMAPSFSVDCLETLEEIKMEGKEDFWRKVEKIFYGCLNDSHAAVKMYYQIINRELLGWLE